MHVSTPRTTLSDGADGLRIPRAAVQMIRSELARVYPSLAKKPFVGTRLCWCVHDAWNSKMADHDAGCRYTDSTNDDWVIGAHPDVENLVLATSGCGHAYKVSFLT